MKRLEAVFGKLKYNEKTFSTIGVRHVHHPDGIVECEQKEYVNAIQIIPPETYSGKSGDEACDAKQTAILWSLVGALGFAMKTQQHMLVYAVCLQRAQHDPKAIHLRRANAILRHMKKYPRTLVYKAMTCSRVLKAFSDSGFRADRRERLWHARCELSASRLRQERTQGVSLD